MNELNRDGLQDMDYDVMKQVIQCEGKGEVCTIINTYNDSVFRGRIQAYEARRPAYSWTKKRAEFASR